MKRHGKLFEKIVSKENVFNAYCKARRGRRWQNTVKVFEQNLDENINGVRESLLNKTYTTASYREKIVYEPKKRIIYILPFAPDRIVQHALMAVIAPIWDKLFISDSYACREGKGMHLASRRVMEFVRKNRYCLHCDISKFYPSIDHDILFNLVNRKIKCKETLWLLQNIVYSFPGGKNAPIGNLTSQWFGNLYMNELDQWIKNYWLVKHYIRYCDDFILFHDDKAFLHTLRDQICEFLKTRLTLTFSKAEIYPVSTGVEFVGYRHFRNYILLRKSTTKRIKKRIAAIPWQIKHGKVTAEQARSSLASTEGWMKWANTQNLVLKLRVENIKEKYGWAA